jgi:hypothetical protein
MTLAKDNSPMIDYAEELHETDRELKAYVEARGARELSMLISERPALRQLLEAIERADPEAVAADPHIHADLLREAIKEALVARGLLASP